jgi:hypothetical protein
MADVIQKDISTFIKNQFPSFYEDEGPVFIAFVETYYKWLESITTAATTNAAASWVSVSSQNTYITGINTHFITNFSSGDSIAIWRSPDLYDTFVINSVANDTLLIVESNPLFSNVKASYAYTAPVRNQLYNSRRILEYVDVDQTISDFIVHFKEKYLSGIQFDTNVDIRLLLKHTLDLYRAKGTPQALELLFRIIFGTNIEIYYPSEDVFRLSDGVWVTPRYIEVTLSDNSILLNNRQIVGSISGATAFVDRVIRRNINGQLSDVLYVSAINGTFVHGDILNFSGPDKLDPSACVSVLGSLTDVLIDVNGTGENFKVGDILDVYSNTGFAAKARVASIVNRSGIADFTFEDGGYAYTTDGNTEILISDHILRVENVNIDVITNPWVNSYVNIFETVTQPTANIAYVSANGSFVPGDQIFTYNVDNSVRGNAKVLKASEANSSTGEIRVALISGDVSSNQFFTVGNAVSANVSAVSGYTNTTATGNVIGVVDNLTLTVSYPNTNIQLNSDVNQYDTVGSLVASGKVIRINTFGANTQYSLSNTQGVFRLGSILYNGSNTVIGNTVNIALSIGVDETVSDFISDDGNYIYSNDSNTRGIVTSVSTGFGVGFEISNTLIYTEDVQYDQSKLYNYRNDAIGTPSTPTTWDEASINNIMGTGSLSADKLTFSSNGYSTTVTTNAAVAKQTFEISNVAFGVSITSSTATSDGFRVVYNAGSWVLTGAGDAVTWATGPSTPPDDLSNIFTIDCDPVGQKVSIRVNGEPIFTDQDVSSHLPATWKILSVAGDASVFGTSFSPVLKFSNLMYDPLEGYAEWDPSFVDGNTYLYDLLNFTTVQFGRISAIEKVNHGTSYTAAPIIRIYDKLSYPYHREDYVLSTDSGGFTIGEEVVQLSTNARGLVMTSNSSISHLKRLRFDPTNDFIPTVNSTTVVTGVLSGISANVFSVDYESDEPSGFDAVFDTNLSVSNGSIGSVSIIDSGFGFYTDQNVTLVNNTSSASGVAVCSTIGTGSGYYKQKGGFLSDQKKLHDGYYYQDFSYDVRSSVTLDKYVDMLKQITHVAGTMNFASMMTTSDMDGELSVSSSHIVGLSSNTDGNVIIIGVGQVAGISNSSFKTITYMMTEGSASGSSNADAFGVTGLDTSGNASGTSTAAANSVLFLNTTAESNNVSNVSGTLIATGTFTGNSVGTATAIGISQ